MAKIKFFGCGSAFTLKNFQTNIGIEENEKLLLIDAGGDIRFSLKEANLNYKNIDALYISHLHADHSGGVEYLGFCTFFDPSSKKIKLYGNGEMLRRGWEDTWKGGMESIQGEMVNLSSYFDLNPVKQNSSFKWQDINFQLVQSVHIMNGYSIVPCFGLMITAQSKKIYFTSDCQFCPSQIIDFYKQADLIIQDCETAPFKSGVHAHFNELCTLPIEIKNKMLLTHYQDNVLDKLRENKISEEWENKASDNGFVGFAYKGFEVNVPLINISTFI